MVSIIVETFLEFQIRTQISNLGRGELTKLNLQVLVNTLLFAEKVSTWRTDEKFSRCFAHHRKKFFVDCHSKSKVSNRADQ